MPDDLEKEDPNELLKEEESFDLEGYLKFKKQLDAEEQEVEQENSDEEGEEEA